MNNEYAVELHGQADDPTKSQYYLLLEFFNCDLQKLIDARKIIPEKQAEIIINQLFRAQHALYLQGCVHRDLKPSNIVLHFDDLKSEVWSDETAMAEFLKRFDFTSNDGNFKFKLIDLGLSETLDENGFASTSTDGTPFYSSPEQLRGGFQTAHSDMWSIGVIYYQLLAGKLPFIGPTRELLVK